MNSPYRTILLDRIVTHQVNLPQHFISHRIERFSFVEDSQGNINPYAVTGCKDQDSWCRENKHTDTMGMGY